MNSEEGERALAIARRKHDEGDFEGALRFAKKAVALGPSAAATNFLQKLQRPQKGAGSATASGSSASSARTAPTPRARPAAPPADDKPHTPQQALLVKRVRSCKVTDYYSILDVEKTCEDVHIKKAYRKLALSLHPDKCSAPGSEEAFKLVSKAFQVLSDGNKRAIYDQTGGDPDVRGGGGGGGGGGAASPFMRRGGMGNGGQFGGDELSPEDLFQFFFGQGGGASFGGGGGGFRTQFYGPGGARMSGGGPRRQQQQQARGPATPTSGWLQVAPLLILFAFSILTQLPNLFGTAAPADPDFSFDLSPHFSVKRSTNSLQTPYFVNARQFSQHPIYKDTLDANPQLLPFSSSHEPGTAGYRQDLLRHIVTPREGAADDTAAPVAEEVNAKTKTAGKAGGVQPTGGPAPAPKVVKTKGPKKLVVPASLAKFERTVDRTWVQKLQQYCQHEINQRSESLERARGFFGFGADWDKVKQITEARLEHCERLSKLGYSVQY